MLRNSSFIRFKRMAAALMTITSHPAGSSRTPLITHTSAWMKTVTSAYVTCRVSGRSPLGPGDGTGVGGMPGPVWRQSEVQLPAGQMGGGSMALGEGGQIDPQAPSSSVQQEAASGYPQPGWSLF